MIGDNVVNEFENEPALQPAQPQPQPQPQPTQQPEFPIRLTLHQEKMLNSMPVGHEHARFAIDIAIDAGFTVKYGRKLIKFLHTHDIINWVPKGSTARYKKWFRAVKSEPTQ